MCISIRREVREKMILDRWKAEPGRPAKLFRISRRMRKLANRRAGHFYDLCGQIRA